MPPSGAFWSARLVFLLPTGCGPGAPIEEREWIEPASQPAIHPSIHSSIHGGGMLLPMLVPIHAPSPRRIFSRHSAGYKYQQVVGRLLWKERLSRRAVTALPIFPTYPSPSHPPSPLPLFFLFLFPLLANPFDARRRCCSPVIPSFWNFHAADHPLESTVAQVPLTPAACYLDRLGRHLCATRPKTTTLFEPVPSLSRVRNQPTESAFR